MKKARSSGSDTLQSTQPLTPAPLCTMVIFGISGDLTKRLLYPAICNLGSQGLLDDNFSIVGIARTTYGQQEFRELMTKDIHKFVVSPAAQKFGLELVNRVHYLPGDLNDPQVYQQLKTQLHEIETTGNQSALFYLAIPPEFIATIANGLGSAGLLQENDQKSFRRILVEKPFGHDLASAKQLNEDLLKVAGDKQIFRIDHFLGKETVQNILALRCANTIIEPLWNNQYIDSIQLTVAETLGVEGRGAYYEHAGALCDMIPNHLFQVLSLLTMETPTSFSPEAIRAAKQKALEDIHVFSADEALTQVVRGQYGPGQIDKVTVKGYRSEPDVNPQSPIETYVALKLQIDNKRWQGVPFYLRTGKCLQVHTSEVFVQFKAGIEKTVPNILHLQLQPNEGISLRFNAKIPGPEMKLDQVEMNFSYQDFFKMTPQTGYETILYEAMNGDHTLFKNAEMEIASWTIVQPILEAWQMNKPKDFPNYAAGTWGPQAADDLLAKDGRVWFNE